MTEVKYNIGGGKDIIAEYDEYGIMEITRECFEALIEKQIPKVPNYEGDGYADGAMVYDVWRCPNCDRDYEVEYDDYDYCPNCGQHIDWGNEDDRD